MPLRRIAALAVSALLLVPAGAGAAPYVVERGLLIGADGSDSGEAIAVDAQGAAIVVGSASSTKFPTTPGAAQPAMRGIQDGFVTKIAPDGTVVYSTYLGAPGGDSLMAVAVDAAGNAYVAGQTGPDLVTTPGAYDREASVASLDAFVVKLDPAGQVVYSTYLGGDPGDEQPNDIAVDAAGSAYVVGFTDGGGFPTTPGADATTSSAPFREGFVAKLDPSGASLAWSTYLGGANDDVGTTIAVDDARGRVLVGAMAQSPGLATAGAQDTQVDGGQDGLLVSYARDSGAVQWATYLGGSQGDVIDALGVDGAGEIFLTGRATSEDWPPVAGTNVIYAARLPADGSAARWYARPFDDNSWPDDLAVDGAGGVWIAGQVGETFAPTPNGAARSGSTDPYAIRLSAADGARTFATTIGGQYGFEAGRGIAALPDGRAWVTGSAGSTGFPATQPPLAALTGTFHAFAARLDPGAATFRAPAAAPPGGGGGTQTQTQALPAPPTQTTTLPRPAVSVAPALRLTEARLTGRRLRFRLNRAASVRAVITGKVAGRRAGKRCVPGRRSGKRCTLTVRRTATYTGRAGTTTLTVKTKGLRPGRYRLTLTVKGAAPVRLTLRVPR